MLIVICLCILTPVLYLCYVMYKNRSLSKLPGPPAIPFFGIKLPTTPRELFLMYENLTRTYGKTFKYYLGPDIRVVTCDINILQYIMKSNIHLRKSTIYTLFEPWCGRGIIISDGDKWKQRRKIVTPTFHFSILNEFLDVMKNSANNLIENLQQVSDNESIDVLKFTPEWSLGVIGETSLGIKFDDVENKKNTYLEAAHQYLESLTARAFSIWKSSDILFKWFSKNYKIEREHLKVLQNLCEQVVANKVKSTSLSKDKVAVDEFGSKQKITLIETLFQHRLENHFTDKEIQEEINNFLFAGFDTSSRALGFALYHLSKHRSIQHRIYEEIVSTFGGDLATMSQTEIQNMKDLDLFVKEVLRITPSVPFIERQLQEDAVIDGVFYPNGTVFSMLIYWVHHNPELYPDSEKFDPSRFTTENSKDRSPFAYIPFSAGPRNCVGQKFAMLEIKTAIIYIVQTFEVHSVPGFEPILGIGPLLGSENGIKIRLKKRV